MYKASWRSYSNRHGLDIPMNSGVGYTTNRTRAFWSRTDFKAALSVVSDNDSRRSLYQTGASFSPMSMGLHTTYGMILYFFIIWASCFGTVEPILQDIYHQKFSWTLIIPVLIVGYWTQYFIRRDRALRK